MPPEIARGTPLNTNKACFADPNAVNNINLVQPMNGTPRQARSILSWNLRPTGCNYQPIWGNVVDYTIRLDQ